MRTHKAGRWVVGVFVVAAVALGIAGVGSHRTASDFDWTAPVGQFVAR
jgi:hypothetical protein